MCMRPPFVFGRVRPEGSHHYAGTLVTLLSVWAASAAASSSARAACESPYYYVGAEAHSVLCYETAQCLRRRRSRRLTARAQHEACRACLLAEALSTRRRRRAQKKDRNRDLLNIEVVALINLAHCRLHHLHHCLPSEELARECTRARPAPPRPPLPVHPAGPSGPGRAPARLSRISATCRVRRQGRGLPARERARVAREALSARCAAAGGADRAGAGHGVGEAGAAALWRRHGLRGLAGAALASAGAVLVLSCLQLHVGGNHPLGGGALRERRLCCQRRHSVRQPSALKAEPACDARAAP